MCPPGPHTHPNAAGSVLTAGPWPYRTTLPSSAGSVQLTIHWLTNASRFACTRPDGLLITYALQTVQAKLEHPTSTHHLSEEAR